MIEPIVLYVEAFWSSPWVATVYVALREKQLPFTSAIAMMSPAVGAIDPLEERTLTGTAPVLQHGDVWISESAAIVEYLEEVFPPPAWPRLWPADVKDRARARQLMSWMRFEHDSLRRERPTEKLLYPPPVLPPSLSPAAQRVADRLVRVATRLGAGPAGHVFDGFGVIDVELAVALMRLIRGGTPVPDAIAAYANAVWDRPSVREFVLHPRPPNAPRR